MNMPGYFRERRVVITGGLGFIGSNLAHRLVSLGAQVRIVDSARPETGANRFNLKSIAADVDLRISDMRDMHVITEMIEDQEYLFNLAGQVSHVESMNAPQDDLEINTVCQLAMVEACRKNNPLIKVVHAGTRQVYGCTKSLPVNEYHPVSPVDYNGVAKLAGEMYHLVGQRVFGLQATSLRMTNIYGPRMRCVDGRQTFLGDWIRRLFMDQPLVVYGTGGQIRDLNYVEDVVDALLLAATSATSTGQIYNLGSPEPIRLIDLACLMIEIFGKGRYELHPFPAERQHIDIGDYQGDYSKIQAELGWWPRVSLHEGLERSFDYFRQHQEHYW